MTLSDDDRRLLLGLLGQPGTWPSDYGTQQALEVVPVTISSSDAPRRPRISCGTALLILMLLFLAVLLAFGGGILLDSRRLRSQTAAEAKGVAELSDGSLVVSGHYRPAGEGMHGESELWLARLEPRGDTAWEYVFGDRYDIGGAVTAHGEGFAVISRAKGIEQAGIVLFDAQGNAKARASVATNGSSRAYALQVGPEESFVLAGGAGRRPFIAQVGATGTRWLTQLERGRATALVSKGEGWLVASEYSVRRGRTYDRYAVVSYLDAQGQVQYDGEPWGEGEPAALAYNGSEFLLAGRKGQRAKATSWTPDGQIKWGEYYGDKRADFSAAEAKGDGWVLAGSTGSSSRRSAWIVELDGQGGLRWEARYGGGKGSDEFSDLVLLEDGTVVAVGRVLTEEGRRACVVANRPGGSVLWERSFGDPGAAPTQR